MMEERLSVSRPVWNPVPGLVNKEGRQVILQQAGQVEHRIEWQFLPRHAQGVPSKWDQSRCRAGRATG